MKLLLAILVLGIITILGTRITFSNRKLPIGFRNILFTGTEYIFIGVILGGMGLNLIDMKALDQLQPFLVFGLCWIGFLFGLQFELRQMKKLPMFYFSITAIQAIITFIIVTMAMYYLFKEFTELPDKVLVMVALTLGGAASCTGQSALAIVSKNFRFENHRLLTLMRYISSVDGLFAMVFFAVALSIIPGGDMGDANIGHSIKWLGISLLMGVVPALILIALSRSRFSQKEFLLFLFGTVMFCGGLAYTIHHSPLVSGFVCGLITANFCRHRLRALSTVLQAEKSIYIIMLIILGASWHFRFDISIIITGIYIMARIFGKSIGAFTATRILKTDIHVPKTIGFGLISEGGLAVAIIINFRLLYPFIVNTLTTVVLLSMVITEFLSPKLIINQFDEKERILPREKKRSKSSTLKR